MAEACLLSCDGRVCKFEVGGGVVLDHKMGLCREEEGTEPRGVAEGGRPG